MKKIIILFLVGIFVFGVVYYLLSKDRVENFSNTEIESNTNDKVEDISIEIIDKKIDINGHNVSIPIVSGSKDTIKTINEMIIEEIKRYIDKESSLYDFHYIVKENDGRYVSIIIELIQYKESLPHPGKQAHAINIDFKEKKLLYNNDFVSDKKVFCEDIKYGRYILLSEISNNIADAYEYIENKTMDELEEMYDNNELEIFKLNQSLGFIAIVPYGIGNYAIFGKTPSPSTKTTKTETSSPQSTAMKSQAARKPKPT